MPASATTSDGLVLTLFGPLQVLVGGQPLSPLRSRKTLWLLALLALRHDRPVEREWLAGTLWPEVTPTRALSNLRSIASELRQALGSQGYRLQSPSRRTLFLDLTGAEVDVPAFDAAIASRSLPVLEQAVRLYRGPLLEGCTEEWVFTEREKREQYCLQILQKLADAALEAGEYEAAVGYYRRAVSLDPWREAARRGLMEALVRKGDRNAALHVYREYVAQLRDTPQAVPDEPTRALYQRLRAEASRQSTAQTVAASAGPAPAVTGYVPHALTELIGREEERIEVADCLRRSRLVTLTGMGGIGKTRLAMSIAHEVGREYPDGVWMVPLEALVEEGQIFVQIASVLGVKEEAGRPLSACVVEYLRRRHLLLVLDNCEHLLTPCAETAGQLLTECAEVRILATSREALGITGEMTWTVPALPAPDPEHLPERQAPLLQVLMAYESVRLFVERARAVQKTFALTSSNARAVAQICFRLEGIPLAIELAAARVGVMSVEQIAARLDSALALLTGGNQTTATQARQQTLRATLDWSYDLLSASERCLLQRLSVFAGGWTLEAAEAVCTESEEDVLSLLTALVDKSLVVFVEREAEAGGRFRMLEMVRQFAGERLAASGEEPLYLARHQEWFIALAEEADPHLGGPEQAQWLRRLATEYDNLRVALARSEQGICSAESALRLASALWPFWYTRGDHSEGREYLTRWIERGDARARTPLRSKALHGAGALAYRQGDYAVAQALLEESLAVRREFGDRKGAAETMGHLGNVHSSLGDYVSARALYEESLSTHRQLADKPWVALMLDKVAALALKQSDYVKAKELYEESLMILRESGNLSSIAWTLNSLGNINSLLGNFLQAQTQYEESLFFFEELGDRLGIAWTCHKQGFIAFRQGNDTQAQALFQESLGVFRLLGNKHGTAGTLQYLGDIALNQGEITSAQAYYEESLSIFKERQAKRGVAWTLTRLGSVACTQGDNTLGRALHKESLSLFQELGEKTGVLTTLWRLATAIQGQDARSAAYLGGAAQTLWERLGVMMAPREQERHEQQVSQTRAILGEDAFVAAWEAGRALTWEQAVDYALERQEAEGV